MNINPQLFITSLLVNRCVALNRYSMAVCKQELLTIAVCEMKEEDKTSQVLYWHCLNEVMATHGFDAAKFFGFMADEAQANWNAVREVFNEGEEMVGRERSCLFHWEQSLNGHTTKYVIKTSQGQHKEMCEKWHTSSTMVTALAQGRVR